MTFLKLTSPVTLMDVSYHTFTFHRFLHSTRDAAPNTFKACLSTFTFGSIYSCRGVVHVERRRCLCGCSDHGNDGLRGFWNV